MTPINDEQDWVQWALAELAKSYSEMPAFAIDFRATRERPDEVCVYVGHNLWPLAVPPWLSPQLCALALARARKLHGSMTS
jgi:hypothetical protein